MRIFSPTIKAVINFFIFIYLSIFLIILFRFQFIQYFSSLFVPEYSFLPPFYFLFDLSSSFAFHFHFKVFISSVKLNPLNIIPTISNISRKNKIAFFSFLSLVFFFLIIALLLLHIFLKFKRIDRFFFYSASFFFHLRM